MAKINKVLYIQHEGSSNTEKVRATTTGDRFKEIQRINDLLYCKYDEAIHNRIIELGYSDPIWDDDGKCSNLNLEIPIGELPIMDVLILE
jgi:hypothetical protein